MTTLDLTLVNARLLGVLNQLPTIHVVPSDKLTDALQQIPPVLCMAKCVPDTPDELQHIECVSYDSAIADRMKRIGHYWMFTQDGLHILRIE